MKIFNVACPDCGRKARVYLNHPTLGSIAVANGPSPLSDGTVAPDGTTACGLCGLWFQTADNRIN